MVGRKEEKELLNRLYNSNKSHFVAVTGRRRIGKTFLIDEVFKNRITFRHSGISPVDIKNGDSPTKIQLQHFYNSLLLAGMKRTKAPENWLDAFLMLELYLQEIDDGSRQLIFIDELPWLDTPKSGFISAFESFWNSWACARRNIMLVVCGSATSWMNDNLINNYGGLYNRLTCEISLKPFTLSEYEEYLKSENIRISRYDIVQSYMITGGIPYYLSYMQSGLSLAQNIDYIFFRDKAPLKEEFNRLFYSIYTKPEFMMEIVKILSKKRYGCTRTEIATILGVQSGGTLSKALNSLVVSDFIIKYVPFNETKNKEYYRLIDPFCIFYLKFIDKQKQLPSDFWLSNVNSPSVVSWRGLAFENVCFNHINQIKMALGISGVSTKYYSWFNSKEETNHTQIDMILERSDNVLNLCEMKFSKNDFEVDANYDKVLRNRVSIIEAKLPKIYAIHNTLITTYGLTYNEYSNDFINVITLDELFK